LRASSAGGWSSDAVVSLPRAVKTSVCGDEGARRSVFADYARHRTRLAIRQRMRVLAQSSKSDVLRYQRP
jgi:hypothetical protein